MQRMPVRLCAAVALLCSALLFGQKPEYDFYADFRDFMSSLWMKDPSVTSGRILEAYTAKLKSEGVPDAEIARRRRLLNEERPQLEADRWDRYYLSPESRDHFNHAPNAFLAAFVANRRPGVALDYAMGNGRNALYLAKLGWDVYGFDHSDVAVAEARKRAEELGLKIHTAAVPDSRYDFGKERFDLNRIQLVDAARRREEGR